jgi:Putative restriction endonuclease
MGRQGKHTLRGNPDVPYLLPFFFSISTFTPHPTILTRLFSHLGNLCPICRPSSGVTALVVAVADSSLRFDTTVKLTSYAAAPIGDYWVLDVDARQLLVFRDPIIDQTSAQKHTYATQLALGSADTIAPLAAPGRTLNVADLLP